jgi:hypothetical protein
MKEILLPIDNEHRLSGIFEGIYRRPFVGAVILTSPEKIATKIAAMKIGAIAITTLMRLK